MLKTKQQSWNAFAKHLALCHSEAQGDINNFTIQVLSTFKKPLPRQKMESVVIADSKAYYLMYSIGRAETSSHTPSGEDKGGTGAATSWGDERRRKGERRERRAEEERPGVK